MSIDESGVIHYDDLLTLCSTPNPFDDFEHGMSKPLTIVSIIKSREAKQATLDLPLHRYQFLNPMTGDCEITVHVVGLPPVACQIDFSGDHRTLQKVRRWK